MTDKCAYPKCEKDLVHTAGRRKKKYCGKNCRTRHWQMEHPAYTPKTKRVAKDKTLIELPTDFLSWESVGIIDKDGKIQELKDISQLPEHIQTAVNSLQELGRSNKFENAARGRDANGINNDELVHQYEEEMSRLGNSQIAKDRRKFLERRIKELKQQS